MENIKQERRSAKALNRALTSRYEHVNMQEEATSSKNLILRKSLSLMTKILSQKQQVGGVPTEITRSSTS